MRIDKDNIKIVLILLIVCLSLGYAYINSDLNINGTAQVKHASWDVHWANVQVSSGSVSASTPTISNQTTVTYSVTLTNPGDYYEFTVDAVNGGSIDAMIDTIDSKLNNNPITNLPAYLNYSVTYEDGIELEPNHLLTANSTETYKVRIEYRTDIEVNQLPTTNQSLSLQFTVTYRQATDNAFEKPYTGLIYWKAISGNSVIKIGDSISGYKSDYTKTVPSRAIFVKYDVEDSIITKAYICFNSDSDCFRGGISPSDPSFAQINSDNRRLAYRVFESCEEISSDYSCRTFNSAYGVIYNSGSLEIQNSGGRIRMDIYGNYYADG